MFSNTAYESMYSYLGLALHSAFIEVITSHSVFLAVISVVFGIAFLMTTAQFFSKYLPGAITYRRATPLTAYLKIVICLFLAFAILKVESHSSVKRFDGKSWHDNPYIRAHVADVKPSYRVSFVFDLLSRTAEEIAWFMSHVVDKLFQSQHSNLSAPSFFFKAILYGGSSTIEDPKLRDLVGFYTEECFDRMIPLIQSKSKDGLSNLYRINPIIDGELSKINLGKKNGTSYTCLDVKNEVRVALRDYAIDQDVSFGIGLYGLVRKYIVKNDIGPKTLSNFYLSSYLANHYYDQHESLMGIQKGSQLPTTTGKIAQYLHRLFSVDGLLGLFGFRDLQGASVAAKRSQNFSEHLARAPHLAGFIKMLLVASFPFLIFFVVAGKWKVLIYWFATYLSVLLWTPIWTLLYHIVVNLSMSAETMAAFGRLSDGISLYSAELVTHRMYHLFAIYSWMQILIGPVFTGFFLFMLRPVLADSEPDSLPQGMVERSTQAIEIGSGGVGSAVSQVKSFVPSGGEK